MGKHSNGSSSVDTNEDNSNSWILGLVLGVCGGALVALLTTPSSGSEVRGALKRTARDVPHRLSEIIEDSLDLYASALNYCQLVIEEQTIRVKRAVAAGRLAAAKKREELELGGTSVLPFQHR
jgi:gas vesicle protein